MSRVTRSEKGYRGTRGVENSPLASISGESEEELARFSLGSAVRLIRECFPLIPPPSMPTPASPTSNPSTPTPTPPPPPPPPKVEMASAIKLPVFKGAGNEEPGWFWFVIRYVWDAQGVEEVNPLCRQRLPECLSQKPITWQIQNHTTKLSYSTHRAPLYLYLSMDCDPWAGRLNFHFFTLLLGELPL